MTTPTQRTLAALRDMGRVCAIVEKWNAYARIRQDMFGIIDIIALDRVRGVVGVQSCGTDFAGHHKKFINDRAQECIQWLETPGTVLELWGWRKVKVKRGGKAMVYRPRVKEYTLVDFMDVDPLKL